MDNREREYRRAIRDPCTPSRSISNPSLAAHVDSLAPPETLQERHDARMMALALQLDFVLNVVVILLRTHFDRHLLPRAALRRFVASGETEKTVTTQR